MPRKVVAVIGLASLFAFALVGCYGSPAESPENRLRQTIKTLQTAVENRKLADLMAAVSENYSDESGRNRKDLQQLARFYLMRHRHPHVFVRIKDIHWENPQKTVARVTLLVATAGQAIDNPGLLQSIRADLLQFEALFVEKDDAGYQLQSIQWQPARPEDFF